MKLLSLCLFGLLFIRCSSSLPTSFRNNTESKELYSSCMRFLEEGNESITEDSLLQELREAAASGRSYILNSGELVYDTLSRRGRHLQLNPQGRIEYFRILPVRMESGDAVNFLCAEHIRWQWEKNFQKAALLTKGEPKNELGLELQRENVKEYGRFSRALGGKPQIIKNFLFFSLDPYITGKLGLPISPCKLSEELKESLKIAVEGLSDRDAVLSWTASIRSISTYELGFTLAGYCNKME